MTRLSVDEVAGILPELDELRPVLDLLFARSVPDPERTWSGSGELGTVGDRLVPADALEGTAETLADTARDHLRNLYEAVGRAVGALIGGEPIAAAEAFLDASGLEEEARRLYRAEAYARAAHRAVRSGRDGRVRARCLRRLARILRGQGRLAEAGSRYQEAFDVALPSGAHREATIAAIGRGNVCVDRGRWSEAESWYRRAEELLEELDAGPEHWHVELNLSIVAYRTGDLDASRRHLERAGELAGELDDPDAHPILGNAWGKLHKLSGEPDLAVERLRAALEAADDPLARVTISVNLADSLLDLDRALDAGELAREAERIALQGGVTPKLPDVYRLLGRVARRQGHEDGLVFYERALELIRSRRLPDFERAQTLEEYGALEMEVGRIDSAEAKLAESARLYGSVGMREDAERVHALLEDHEEDPDASDTDV